MDKDVESRKTDCLGVRWQRNVAVNHAIGSSLIQVPKVIGCTAVYLITESRMEKSQSSWCWNTISKLFSHVDAEWGYQIKYKVHIRKWEDRLIAERQQQKKSLRNRNMSSVLSTIILRAKSSFSPYGIIEVHLVLYGWVPTIRPIDPKRRREERFKITRMKQYC